MSKHSEHRLSNLGGTLGLFTGISIISMVEAVFWLYRACFTIPFAREGTDS